MSRPPAWTLTPGGGVGTDRRPRRDGVTVLLTTHQLKAEELADRIVIIDRGATVASERPG